MPPFSSIHEPLPLSKKCQFCNNYATVMINDLDKKPVFWMCNEHILFFIWGLLEDIKPNPAIQTIIQAVKVQQEKEIAEREALHV